MCSTTATTASTSPVPCPSTTLIGKLFLPHPAVLHSSSDLFKEGLHFPTPPLHRLPGLLSFHAALPAAVEVQLPIVGSYTLHLNAYLGPNNASLATLHHTPTRRMSTADPTPAVGTIPAGCHRPSSITPMIRTPT